MALDGTYTGLLASLADWSDRSDMSAVFPDCVALFEANANTEGAIRTQFNRIETTQVTGIAQNYISTPSDFLAVDSAIIVKSGGQYESLTSFGSASAMYTAYPNSALAPSQPKGFINLASKLELGPVPDAVYSIRLYYYQKIPALVTNSSNWLLTNFPQIYLFGSLVASESYLGTDQAISKWGNLYDNAIQKLQGSVDRNKYGGSALKVQMDAVA